MSAPAPTSTPSKPTADQLLRAAELKAEGNSWPAIGRDLNVDSATVTRWRVDYPNDWKVAAGRFRQFALGDALGEALCTLRRLSRSSDEKISLAAAGWIVRYWSAAYRHRPRTAAAAVADRDAGGLTYDDLVEMANQLPPPLPPLDEDDDTPPDDGGAGEGPRSGSGGGGWCPGFSPSSGGSTDGLKAGHQRNHPSHKVKSDRGTRQPAGSGDGESLASVVPVQPPQR